MILLIQSDETDVSQFDTKFTKQTPVDSPDDATLSESANKVFYVRTSLPSWFYHILRICLNYYTVLLFIQVLNVYSSIICNVGSDI